MVSFNIKKDISEKGKMKQRQKLLKSMIRSDLTELFQTSLDINKVAKKNCENFIGSVEIPVGLAGPLQIQSDIVPKQIIIPLATTEGALVASTNRGAKVISLSQTGKVLVKKIGMTRAPVFKCQDITAAQEFKTFLEDNFVELKKISESTSNHLKLLSFNCWTRGQYVFVRFVFDTDKAMGMNMVTIALKHVWSEYVSKKTKAELISLSGNVCADKKDSLVNRILGRGYSVEAEVFIPPEIVTEVLQTTKEKFYETHIVKNLIGSNIAGSFSQNMQAANIIAAVFLATGQDVAHVVEASQCATTVTIEGENLYVAVSLPNINLGVTGGGTWLPAQAQARKLIQEGGEIDSKQLAAAVGIGVLAGEISGLASLANNSLADAHQKFAR